MPPAGGCSSGDRVTGTVHRRRETVSRSRRSFGGCLITAVHFGSGRRATRSQKQTLCSDTEGMSPSVVSVLLMVLVVGTASLGCSRMPGPGSSGIDPSSRPGAASRLTGRKCGRPCASWRWFCSCRSTSWRRGPSRDERPSSSACSGCSATAATFVALQIAEQPGRARPSLTMDIYLGRGPRGGAAPAALKGASRLILVRRQGLEPRTQVSFGALCASHRVDASSRP